MKIVIEILGARVYNPLVWESFVNWITAHIPTWLGRDAVISIEIEKGDD